MKKPSIAGIAAVSVYGVGNLIVGYNMPPERHDLAIIMIHRGYIVLGILFGILVLLGLVKWLTDWL